MPARGSNGWLLAFVAAIAVVAALVAVIALTRQAPREPSPSASETGAPRVTVAAESTADTTASQAPTDTASPSVATPGATAGSPGPVADPVLLAAGDIADCGLTADEETATLLDVIPGTVAALGDLVYPSGTPAQFAECYAPSWGRHAARTQPVPGNHDYETQGAAGYFGYFGAAAGDPSQGWYSYDIGRWHVVALNSICAAVGGCGPGSPQEQWLRADLAAHPVACTLAYWHHPRFSSAQHGSDATYDAFWQALYEFGADVVLVGHDHVYERFAPQTPTGARDDAAGIRQFTVGTGGRSHYEFGSPLATSEARDNTSFGVLALTLRAAGYEWEFVPTVPGGFTDSGGQSCSGGVP